MVFVSHSGRAAGRLCSRFDISAYGMGLLGNLLVRRAGQADYEALLLERIYRPVSDLEITFYRNNRGQVDRAVGVVGGITYEARKVH